MLKAELSEAFVHSDGSSITRVEVPPPAGKSTVTRRRLFCQSNNRAGKSIRKLDHCHTDRSTNLSTPRVNIHTSEGRRQGNNPPLELPP